MSVAEDRRRLVNQEGEGGEVLVHPTCRGQQIPAAALTSYTCQVKRSARRTET